MNTPFLSLITPVYNIERLISKTIESALEQIFSDWEMILVDDGSPDDAGRICDEYASKDERIRVIHKKNEGLPAARNTGIQACRGKYFLIYEGSDLFSGADVLKRIYEILTIREVDIFFARFQSVLETGWKVYKTQSEYCVNGYFEDGGKELFVKLYNNQDWLALSSPVNKVFRTCFIKNNELWFYPGIYHDDDEWLPRTISLSKVSFFTNDIIYNSVAWDGCLGLAVSDKSLTKKACDKMFIAERCCDDVTNRFRENKTSFQKKFIEYYVRMFIDGIASLNVIKDENCRNMVKSSIVKHQKVFEFMKMCESGKIKALSYIEKYFGIKIATKLIQKRYK